jgi:hypothetical protein
MSFDTVELSLYYIRGFLGTLYLFVPTISVCESVLYLTISTYEIPFTKLEESVFREGLISSSLLSVSYREGVGIPKARFCLF